MKGGRDRKKAEKRKGEEKKGFVLVTREKYPGYQLKNLERSWKWVFGGKITVNLVLYTHALKIILSGPFTYEPNTVLVRYSIVSLQVEFHKQW